MIRLFVFISIISCITKAGGGADSLKGDGHDSLTTSYHQFLKNANTVSGEPVDYTHLDVAFIVMMDYGHCSKCAKEVLEFMANADKSGFRVAMIHYGSRESYGPNRAARNKYTFEYAYLQEVYFSPISLPDKSKVPIVALTKSGRFIDYENFSKESELLLVKEYKQ